MSLIFNVKGHKMRNLLASTAAALVLGTSAYADAHTMGIGTAEVSADDIFASDFIGMRLYALDIDLQDGGIFDAADGWEDIGEINDLVVSYDGDVAAAIVGVGGFLGIGEKDVAISMDRIEVYTDAGGSRFLVIDTTAEVLENAPAFGMALDGEAAMATDEVDTAQEVIAAETDPMTGAAPADAIVADGMATEMSWLDNYAAVDVGELGTDELVGATVYDAFESNIGEVGELVLSADGQLEGAVIDVGGFLGMGEKPVLLGLGDLTIMRQIEGEELIVTVDMTEEQLEALPDYEG